MDVQCIDGGEWENKTLDRIQFNSRQGKAWQKLLHLSYLSLSSLRERKKERGREGAGEREEEADRSRLDRSNPAAAVSLVVDVDVDVIPRHTHTHTHKWGAKASPLVNSRRS